MKFHKLDVNAFIKWLFHSFMVMCLYVFTWFCSSFLIYLFICSTHWSTKSSSLYFFSFLQERFVTLPACSGKRVWHGFLPSINTRYRVCTCLILSLCHDRVRFNTLSIYELWHIMNWTQGVCNARLKDSSFFFFFCLNSKLPRSCHDICNLTAWTSQCSILYIYLYN